MNEDTILNAANTIADAITCLEVAIGGGDNTSNLAKSTSAVARAIDRLGNADASTPMGGLEAHGLAVKEGLSSVAEGLHDVAEAIREYTRENSE